MKTKETTIRNATVADIPQVLILIQELEYSAEDTSEFRAAWETIINDSRMGVVVAVTDDVISGYLAYSYKPQLRLSGLSMEMDELAVSSQFRGRGIGSELLNHTKKLASDHNIKRIILSTNRERESYKRGFYSRNGFIEKNSAWMMINLN